LAGRANVEVAILPDRVGGIRDGRPASHRYAKALDCGQLKAYVGIVPLVQICRAERSIVRICDSLRMPSHANYSASD